MRLKEQQQQRESTSSAAAAGEPRSGDGQQTRVQKGNTETKLKDLCTYSSSPSTDAEQLPSLQVDKDSEQPNTVVKCETNSAAVASDHDASKCATKKLSNEVPVDGSAEKNQLLIQDQ